MMIRTTAIAASAALLLASSAGAQSIHISTVGKTTDQVKTEVYKAARTLCAAETFGTIAPLEEYRACVEDTVKTTFAQSKDLALATAQR